LLWGLCPNFESWYLLSCVCTILYSTACYATILSHDTYATVDVPKGSTTRDGRVGTLTDPTREIRDHFSEGMGPVDHKYLTSVDAVALVSRQEVFSPRGSVSLNTGCRRKIFVFVAREVKGERRGRAAHGEMRGRNHVAGHTTFTSKIKLLEIFLPLYIFVIIKKINSTVC
jgi:hypothetical protein